MEKKEFVPTPLEQGEGEPVWANYDEESHYVPVGQEQYYNTNSVYITNNNQTVFYRKFNIEYQKFLQEHAAWLNRYKDYNGCAAQQRKEEQEYKEKMKDFKFILGEEGAAKAKEFKENIDKNSKVKCHYRYVVYPTSLGTAVDIEAYTYDFHTDTLTVYDKEEVVDQL